MTFNLIYISVVSRLKQPDGVNPAKERRRTLNHLKKKYPNFYDAFVNTHRYLADNGQGHRGHGPDHDLMVAGYCLLITDNGRVGEKAWIAALLHSFDRFFGDEVEEKITEMLQFLPENEFSPEELAEIREAIHRHNQPNATDDGPVQVVLQDADRLANVGPMVIYRSGQFHSVIPAIEIGFTPWKKNPASTLRKPRSGYDNMLNVLEWEADPRFGLRLEKSKRIGKKYFDFLRSWFQLVHDQLDETGLAS